MRIFTLSGRVRTSGKNEVESIQSGVGALTIEAVTPRGTNVYAQTLTARDGTYSLVIQEREHPRLFKREQKLTVQLRDRDGEVLERAATSRKVKAGAEGKIDVRLSAADLANHLSRPLFASDLARGGSVRPLGHINRSRQAISRLARGDSAELNRLSDLLPCLEPQIGRFGTLVDDAIGTLDGDPRATRRYRATLDELIQRVSKSESFKRVRRMVGARGNPYSDTASLVSKRQPHRPVIDRDTGAVLLIGAIEAAAGDLKLAEDYLGVVAHQIGAYQRLVPLYEAGERALDEGGAGLSHFGSMLDNFERFCDPGFPNPDEVAEWEPGVLECSYQGLDNLVQPGITYVIDGISGATCAGEQITISG